MANPDAVAAAAAAALADANDADVDLPPEVNLNQAQIQIMIRALNAARGGGARKVSTYTEATPGTWLVWRKHFRTVATINNWADLRQRREAAASMDGQAGKLVRDIEIEPILPAGAPAFTIDNLLTAYENQFMPPQESDLAISAFESATQMADETPILWAARCKELYVRAYPAGGPNDRALINRFNLGLADRDVATYVHEQRPLTFDAASTAAQQKTASKQFLTAQWRGGGRGQNRGGVGGINGIDNRWSEGGPRCWFCQKKGHGQKNCTSYRTAAQAAQKKAGTAGTGGGNRRFGGGGRGRGGGNQVASIPPQEERQTDDPPTNDSGN